MRIKRGPPNPSESVIAFFILLFYSGPSPSPDDGLLAFLSNPATVAGIALAVGAGAVAIAVIPSAGARAGGQGGERSRGERERTRRGHSHSERYTQALTGYI